MKSVHIWNFSDLYFPTFALEKLRIQTLFTQCNLCRFKLEWAYFYYCQIKGEKSTKSIYNMDSFWTMHLLKYEFSPTCTIFTVQSWTIFKVIVINEPVRKVKYQAIRVEVQVRGSPHIHSFLWIVEAPVLSKSNVVEYTQFIDGIVKAFVPDIYENIELFDLVTTYQVHSHSKSCWKYKNEKCRSHLGKSFTERSIVSLPLQNHLPDPMKNNILNERELILLIVKNYIDTQLYPRKRNILYPHKENFENIPSIRNILAELKPTKEEYYEALSISSDSDFQIHLKQKPNACFINNFLVDGLQAWNANIDIQSIFNIIRQLLMCAYFPKAEDKTSETMKHVAKEALSGNK